MPAAAAISRDQVHDHRLRRDVEAGGRLVGDQQRGLAGERHGDHHALAHAAREFERIGRERGVPGSGMRTRAQRLDRRAAARRGAARCRGAISTSSICWPTVRIGLSAVRGFWKIIAISRPRSSAQSRRGGARRSMPPNIGCGRAVIRAGRVEQPMMA